jgi:hypothetical protein
METLTALVARSTNYKSTTGSTVADGIRKEWVGLSGRLKLAAADIDDVGPMLKGL